jgi:spore maturation protein CgeB
MRFALFYQSVVSDWNHGNAHFLRGLMRSLQARGHRVICHEQADNWSLQNLLLEAPNAIAEFEARFPDLRYERYAPGPELEATLRDRLAGAEVTIVHEWNEPEVIDLLGRLCARLGVRSLFHDTHYRVVLDAAYRARLGLERFDEILAFSPSVAQRYADLGYRNVHVVHEAADTTVFAPQDVAKTDDVVFVGNYGDGDRNEELERYVFEPRRALPHLRYAMYGVRYPAAVLGRMRDGLGIEFRGRAANVDVACIYSAAKVVLHIPRRQYVELLPGTPTIRVFEALASGACLVSLPWPDTDGLFSAGRDYAVAHTPAEMRDLLALLCADPAAREQLARHSRQTILARHTCDHRAEQLLEIVGCTTTVDRPSSVVHRPSSAERP